MMIQTPTTQPSSADQQEQPLRILEGLEERIHSHLRQHLDNESEREMYEEQLMDREADLIDAQSESLALQEEYNRVIVLLVSPHAAEYQAARRARAERKQQWRAIMIEIERHLAGQRLEAHQKAMQEAATALAKAQLGDSQAAAHAVTPLLVELQDLHLAEIFIQHGLPKHLVADPRQARAELSALELHPDVHKALQHRIDLTEQYELFRSRHDQVAELIRDIETESELQQAIAQREQHIVSIYQATAELRDLKRQAGETRLDKEAFAKLEQSQTAANSELQAAELAFNQIMESCRTASPELSDQLDQLNAQLQTSTHKKRALVQEMQRLKQQIAIARTHQQSVDEKLGADYDETIAAVKEFILVQN